MDLKSSDKDLPLMANVCDILVNHYSFQLTFLFEEHQFCGHVLVELAPLTDCCSVCLTKLNSTKSCRTLNSTESCRTLNSTESCRTLNSTESCRTLNSTGSAGSKINMECCPEYSKLKDFIFILDCNDIIVHNIHEVLIDKGTLYEHKFKGAKLNELITVKLSFVVEKWSLKIWKPGITCACNFPKIIKIDYQTKPEGQSLLWVKDQDCRPAVYTYGAWINNRSLYPCQEPPTAMATWEAYISVTESAVVLMSGDNTPSIFSNEGITTYYYYTKMKLPLSTLALAVGFWDVDQQQCNGNVTFRISAAPSILANAVEEFTHYASLCLDVTESLLGPYPFSRLDFLIVPRGFCSLGMASPNIVFLSQSLLSSNRSMCCRVAHEIAHAWFGLMIGALDWTEEWLSEGFATFMEDLIHTKALSMDHAEERQYCEIKAHFRLNTLLAEIRNTEEELQVLRPNKGEIVTENIDGIEAVILKNGRNSEKAFMQVHYIKGYFLLKYLSDLVGQPEFLKFLNLYVTKYKGQLVESTEMLAFFVETFPEICSDHNVTVDKIVSDWLHSAGIPKELLNFELSFAKNVFETTLKEAKKWRSLNIKCLKKNPKRKKYDLCEFSVLSSEKLLILLDELLKAKKIAFFVLKHLEQFYDLANQDAEVQHKWCELIIKHRYHPGYACVKNFLLNDLAMGIYLYGELILNGTLSQKQLAESSFNLVRKEMEPNCIVTIEQMFETATRK